MAAKDLQIIRTRPAVMAESGSTAPSDRQSHDNPVELLVDVARRQWILLLLIIVTSAVAGAAYASQFSVETITAHLSLERQAFPLATADIYTVPTPESVATLVRSPRVVDSIAKSFELPSAAYLNLCMNVEPDSRSGIVTINLRLTADKDVEAILNAIGDAVQGGQGSEGVIAARRREGLESLRKYTESLIAARNIEVSAAITNYANAVSSAATSSDLELASRYESLLSQQSQRQLEAASLKRSIERLHREIRSCGDRLAGAFEKWKARIRDQRRKQIEGLADGMRTSTRPYAIRQELLKQLDALILPGDRDPDVVADPGGQPTPSGEGVAATPPAVEDESIKVDSTAEPVVAQQEANIKRDSGDDAELLTLESFRDVVSMIREVGLNHVGEFDALTAADIDIAMSELSMLQMTMAGLQQQSEDSSAELVSQEESLQELSSSLAEMKQRLQKDVHGTVDVRVLNAESELEQAKLGQVALEQRLDRVIQVIGWNEREYAVIQSASVDQEKDVKSNWLKLFVFSAFSSGLLMCLPVALLEWLRLRPAPTTVLSRRWNLPILGIQPAARLSKQVIQQPVELDQHSLRMMALRIQQSLYQPNGKVVLFSGLDHEDSPLLMIRDIAKCLSQREETVLILQTLPCQVELARNSRGDGKRIGRPGVAEFLTGEYDNPIELIIQTGIAGVDFLPGGCTATASEAMASSRLTSLVEGLREKYSTILVCGPSTLHPPDLQMVAARADGIVFTVNKQSLRGVYGQEVINDLIELGAPILGFAEQSPHFSLPNSELTSAGSEQYLAAAT